MQSKTKTALIWVALIVVFIAAVIYHSHGETPSPLAPQDYLSMIHDGQVVSYRIDGSTLQLSTNFGASLPAPASPGILKALAEARIPAEIPHDDSPWAGVATIAAIVGGALAVLYFVLRRAKGGTSTNSIFQLRKTKARLVAADDKAKFTDIGGNRAAVELLGDIADFLRAPERWTAAGVRIPRGVLVVGPPGTGKTLLARAVAGETNAAFFYTSASEFVEMFVGVGAARVRDTFEKAAKEKSAIVFIDELDAVGRRRGSGSGAMHEEREQTLNQLLVLLDGMERHRKLVVMAATNRPDTLDPALLRPGRFDRVLRLELPTAAERVEILKIHTRNKSLDPAVSLESIAERAAGFSGADLESLCNAAGLLAIRRTRGSNGDATPGTIDHADFARAYDDMVKSNRVFARLDAILVESASQFAEPVGLALARVKLVTGSVLEGRVQWMNATHFKLRMSDDSEVIVSKDHAVEIVALDGSESGPVSDVKPDGWVGKDLAAS